MPSKAFKDEFLKILALLDKEQQNKALIYTKSLLNEKSTQKEILQLAGSIDLKSIQEMNAAIEADCENISQSEW